MPRETNLKHFQVRSCSLSLGEKRIEKAPCSGACDFESTLRVYPGRPTIWVKKDVVGGANVAQATTFSGRFLFRTYSLALRFCCSVAVAQAAIFEVARVSPPGLGPRPLSSKKWVPPRQDHVIRNIIYGSSQRYVFGRSARKRRVSGDFITVRRCFGLLQYCCGVEGGLLWLARF